MQEYPEKDFNGYLEGITLADLVQLACLERYERKLEVRGPDFLGVVYFSKGEVVHAVLGELTGKEAFVEIMCLPRGTFSFTPGKIGKQTISDSWNLLLMEAVREVDERNDIRDAKTDDEKLRVLVVDDSRIFSKALVKLFDEDIGAKIIGKASNGEEAIQFLEMEAPDFVTLDINMPVMGGDVALKHIMIKTPAPVILMSSFNARNFPMMMDYLCIGAVDLVEKPKDTESWNIVGKRLKRLARNIHQFKIENLKRTRKPQPVGYQKKPGGKVEKLVLVIGGLGGLVELQRILVSIRRTKSIAGLAFLDLYPGVTDHLAEYYDTMTICNPLPLVTGVPLLASDFGMTYWHGSWELAADKDGTVFPFMNNKSGILNVDELVKSAARIFEKNLSVLVLSGTDLALHTSLKKVKEKGGQILLQDPDTCLFPEPLLKLEELQIHDGYIDTENEDEESGFYW